GERQRLAIVRALYRQPAILILDEATSALDPVSELRIMELLKEKLSEGLTLIMISHKIRSIMNADQVLFLDQGRVAEQGTHAELIRLEGKYSRYWKLQNE
ncbi:MAG: ATP-binding cassette domain-containing protein, partial [Bacteroidales bacterium]|nr:ATP-binding cassette domain-containing protein [Bacteroidales bacterium]